MEKKNLHWWRIFNCKSVSTFVKRVDLLCVGNFSENKQKLMKKYTFNEKV